MSNAKGGAFERELMKYLREDLKWNYLVGFALLLAAVFFVFKKW